MKKISKVFTAITCSCILLLNSLVPSNCGAVFVTNILSNYPLCYQGSTPFCWANSMVSMLNFRTSTHYPTEYVLYTRSQLYPNDPPISGLPNSKAKSIIDAIFPNYSTTEYYSHLSQSQIISQISTNYPVYITGYSSSSAHAVALVGYKLLTDDGDVYRIYYMNPQHNPYNSQLGQLESFPDYIESATYSETYGTYHFYSTDMQTEYTWNYSITLH
ncbi:MAG: hypothetical protein KBI35_09150 [Ruminococcus sp.]|nr:hypothetical protein [Ruminococcus sp.]